MHERPNRLRTHALDAECTDQTQEVTLERPAVRLADIADFVDTAGIAGGSVSAIAAPYAQPHQVAHERAIRGFVERGTDLPGAARADSRYPRKALFTLTDLGKGGELGGNRLGSRQSDLRKVECREKLRQWYVANGDKPFHESAGALLVERNTFHLDLRESEKRVLPERIEVGRRLDELVLDQHRDELFAEGVDVHRALAREVRDPRMELGGTPPAAGAQVVGALRTHLLLARRTFAGHGPGIGARRPALRDNLDHLGDDIAGPLNPDPIPAPHVQLAHEILVVQGGAAHRHSGHQHRAQVSDRSQLPGSTDLDDDVHEFGLLLPRGELERHRPSRASRPFSKLALVGEPVDLHDYAVEFYGQPITRALEVAMVGEDVIHRAAGLGPRGLPVSARVDSVRRRHAKSEVGERCEHLRLSFRSLSRLRFPEEDVVTVESQGTRPGDPGIELTQRAGGGVPRVLERLLSFGGEFAVHALEVGDGVYRLAPHREPFGYVSPGQPQR